MCHVSLYSKISMDGAGGNTSNITVVQGRVQVCSHHKQAQIACKSQTPLAMHVHCTCTCVPVLVLFILCLYCLVVVYWYDYLS